MVRLTVHLDAGPGKYATRRAGDVLSGSVVWSKGNPHAISLIHSIVAYLECIETAQLEADPLAAHRPQEVLHFKRKMVLFGKESAASPSR